MSEGEELSKKQAAQEQNIKKVRSRVKELENEKQRVESRLQVRLSPRPHRNRPCGLGICICGHDPQPKGGAPCPLFRVLRFHPRAALEFLKSRSVYEIQELGVGPKGHESCRPHWNHPCMLVPCVRVWSRVRAPTREALPRPVVCRRLRWMASDLRLASNRTNRLELVQSCVWWFQRCLGGSPRRARVSPPPQVEEARVESLRADKARTEEDLKHAVEQTAKELESQKLCDPVPPGPLIQIRSQCCCHQLCSPCRASRSRHPCPVPAHFCARHLGQR